MESNKEIQSEAKPVSPALKIGETVIFRPESIAHAQLEQPQAAVMPAGELYSRSQEFGRLLVEAPQGAAAAYSSQELLQVAETIKVGAVSLRDMRELGRIDEAGLRRLVEVFQAGGDLAQAADYEIKQQALKYERDPRLRQAVLASLAAQAQTAGADAGTGTDGSKPPAADATVKAGGDQPETTKTSAYSGARPTPDAATLRAVRNKQILTIAGTAVAVTLSVLFLLRITR